ncbi:hypothetical protein P7C70_g1957, partial [Phenoliferia sp. Uapishka_3]
MSRRSSPRATLPQSQPHASTSANAAISVCIASTQLPQDTLVVNLVVGGTCTSCQTQAASVNALDISLLADAIVQKLMRLVPPLSRTHGATALLDAILALGAGHMSYLRKETGTDDRAWSVALRKTAMAAISSLEESNGGVLTAGPAGLGSEVELVLAAIGVLMYSDTITAETDFTRPLAKAAAAIRHNGGPGLLLLSTPTHYLTDLDYRRLLVFLSGVDVYCTALDVGMRRRERG